MFKTRSYARTIALSAVMCMGLVACGNDGPTSPGNSSGAADVKVKSVKIGVTDAGQPYWQTFKKEVKDRLKIEVTLVNFSDYNQPNAALAEGELDMNEYQHLQYLANYNVKQNQDLQPIGATAVYPLPLYSAKYKTVEEIPDGAQIAIPNDPVNSARALRLLDSAGLISLKGEVNTTTTMAQIDKASSKVEVIAVDAKQTAQQVSDLAGAVVNNNYATAAKLSDRDILTQDDADSDVTLPYVNAFVVRDSDKDNVTYQKIAAVYHEKAVEAAVRKDLGTEGVFKTTSAADLQRELASIKKDIRSSK